jgi:hypothetical protein
MKYYSEEDTQELRLALEKEVLCWYQVDFKMMFGCPCYKVNGKLFVFLVTNGIVLTRLAEADRTNLAETYRAKSFQAGSKEMKSWCQINFKTPEMLVKLLPFVRKSYEAALRQ